MWLHGHRSIAHVRTTVGCGDAPSGGCSSCLLLEYVNGVLILHLQLFKLPRRVQERKQEMSEVSSQWYHTPKQLPYTRHSPVTLAGVQRVRKRGLLWGHSNYLSTQLLTRFTEEQSELRAEREMVSLETDSSATQYTLYTYAILNIAVSAL